MENEIVTPTSIMQKTASDLTVGDHLKISLVTVAVMAAIPAALIAIGVGWERVRNYRTNRKTNNNVVTLVPNNEQ
jgi:hypothetical protein